MCIANENRSTKCVCPGSCPDEYKPVCSVYLREFSNTCELHKFACHIGIMMGIERRGKCDVKGVLFLLLHEQIKALREKRAVQICKYANILARDLARTVERESDRIFAQVSARMISAEKKIRLLV